MSDVADSHRVRLAPVGWWGVGISRVFCVHVLFILRGHNTVPPLPFVVVIYHCYPKAIDGDHTLMLISPAVIFFFAIVDCIHRLWEEFFAWP